ncbi:hypothetical protein [uncultured Xanthomonas sp.]|nr:hypothetical protein [uncultured Xanthomonas sp.]
MITLHGTRNSSGALRFAMVLTLLALFASSAFAATEGKKQQFLVRDTAGNSYGPYDTQIQAEAAIRTIPGPSDAPDAYQYVTEIKSTSLSEKGEASIIYWMGKKERKLQFWGINGLSADTEEDLVKKMVASLNQGHSPPCASSTFVRVSDWYPYSSENKALELGDYQYTGSTFDGRDG